MIYDLIIIGGGPAGMSAGIYAARKKLKAILIAKELGGQPIEAWQIENFLGFESILGVDLSRKFVNHLKKFSDSIKIKEEESVVEIKGTKGTESLLGNSVPNKVPKKIPKKTFEVHTDKNRYQTKTIIIATGVSPKKLGIPGEEEFKGRGVVFCATCDAPMFQGKTVAVVGAGNSGLDAAIQLTKYAKKIYLINKYPDLAKGDPTYAEKIKNSPQIEIINNARIKEIKGDKFVSSILIERADTEKQEEIEVEGVFVEIGSAPSLHFLGNLVEYNQKGEIIIKLENNMTTCPGIFAAGDTTNIPHKQIIIAAGEGAKAALGAYEYLNLKNF